MTINNVLDAVRQWSPVVGMGMFLFGIAVWFRDMKGVLLSIRDNHLHTAQQSLDKMPEAIANPIVAELRELRQDIREGNSAKAREFGQ